MSGWWNRRVAGWRRPVVAVLVSAIAVVGGAAAGVAAEVVSAPPPAFASPAAVSATQLNNMFREYGDRGVGWTGGDGTLSVPLPDGRVAWVFSDTFLGTVNPDGSRPRTTPMVNNVLVVQDGAALVDTLVGGSRTSPNALVTPEQPGEFAWVADGLVEQDQLRVLYNRYTRIGSGGLDVELTGTSLATFSLPDLTLTGVVDLPVGTAITWGVALVSDGPYTYIYGSSVGLAGVKFAHLARAAAGDIGGAWEYWTGSGWSGEEGSAARILSGVGSAFGVSRVGDEYVLVTQEGHAIFDPQVVAYTASGPAGPFTGPTHLLTAPEPEPGGDLVIYTARVHPELAQPGKLLFSYDVNTFANEDLFADARIYRPRFVEVAWPPAGPPGVPGAPANLVVDPDPSGVVNLSWNAAPGADEYYVHYRDVTAGQTHFYRRHQPVTDLAAEVHGLITGHVHEFRVTAANGAGEGTASATVTVTVRKEADASVVRFSGSPDAITNSYLVRLEKTTAIRDRGVEAVAQELVDQAGGGTIDRLFPLTLNGFAATLTEAQAIEIAGHPDVADVEQDVVLTLQGEQVEPWNWGLDRIDQRFLPLDQRYRYPNTAGPVDAYVIDTGVWSTHTEFNRLRLGRNTIDGNMLPVDCNGHGTHVAGILGGREFGVAKDVRLTAVKVLDCQGEGTSTSVTKGIEWALNEALKPENADTPAVFNLSLGTLDLYIEDPDETSIGVATTKAMQAGITVVAAAGNDNMDACHTTPAGVTGVITVGNIDPTDTRHDSSNWGACVDLFAPGTDIASAWTGNDTNFDIVTGTSMAAPHVAGTAAMMLTAHPSLSHHQVRQLLIDTATTGVVYERGSGSPNRMLFVEQPPTDAPENLSATPDPDGTVHLEWQPVTVPHTNAFYVVSQRDVTAGETEFTRWSLPVMEGTTATAEGLTDGHTYEFRVAAATSTGVGPWSNVATAVAHTQPPGPPTNLTATSNADGTITLNWTPPEDGLWYWIYQRNATEGQEEPEFTKLELPLTTCCTFTASMLEHDQVYEFKVAGINAGGEGDLSEPASARAVYPPTEPPTGLTASAGDGEVTLNWTASETPNTWYWIYQRNVSADETAFTKLELPLTTCCTFTAGYLANGDEYEFKVVAIGPGGDSPASNTARATPLPPKPSKVTGLTATARPDGSIRISWNAMDGVFFWVYQRRASAGESFQRLDLPTTNTSFTTAPLEHNQAYEFRVRAENLAGVGPLSDSAAATARYQPPPAPGNLQAARSGDGYIDLDWTAPAAGGLYYWVYYRNVDEGESFQRSLPTTDTSARLGPFVHGDVYEFKVSAENVGGEGPRSSAVRVTSRGGLPRPPSNLTAQAGNGKVTLHWSASPSDGVWYWIEYRESGGSWHRLDYPDTTCCGYTVSYLTNGTRYEFRVRAVNASGSSAASNTAAARPMPPKPAAPTNLSASAGNGKVTLRWTASTTSSVYYWIEYRKSGGSWRRLQYPDSTCCSFTVSYLTNGTRYDFRVRATNLAGDSSPSNVASARPMPPRPAAPTNLRASAGDGEVTLRWTASTTSAVYYWVEYRPLASSQWRRLPYPLSRCCTHTVEPLGNFRWYEFRVFATNLAGDSRPSNVATAYPESDGGCDVIAGEPGMVDFDPGGGPPGTLTTRGTALAGCHGPVSHVRLDIIVEPVGYASGTGGTRYLGSVAEGATAGGTYWVTDEQNYPCLYYRNWVRITWNIGPTPFGVIDSRYAYSGLCGGPDPEA